MAKERAPKKTVIGTVVSDKMDKTITVRQERKVKHPRYGKYVRRAMVYKAHDEANEAREGDWVEILYGRPLSKSKHWRLLRVVRRAGREAEEDAASATPATRSEQEAASSEVAEAFDAFEVAEAPPKTWLADSGEEGTAS